MTVLGVSGSPIADSNTDRALRAALEATGRDYEFIKLSDCRLEPCRACLGCVATNRCVIDDDDGRRLADLAREAEALIVAGYTPYSTIDARTKSFLERLYPLRHRKGLMAGKPGGAIVTCAVPEDADMLPPAGAMGINAVRFYMMEEGMNFMGSVTVLGNVPCIKCGHGDECDLSGIRMMHGPEATVASVGVNLFEEQAGALAAAADLGRRIGAALSER